VGGVPGTYRPPLEDGFEDGKSHRRAQRVLVATHKRCKDEGKTRVIGSEIAGKGRVVGEEA